jgi:hypothetical protein
MERGELRIWESESKCLTHKCTIYRRGWVGMERRELRI